MTRTEMVTTENVLRRSVMVLLALRSQTVEQLAAAVGIPKSTLYRRLKSDTLDQAFRAHEVAAIADHFDVPVGDLYAGLSGLVKPALVDATHGYRPTAGDVRPAGYALAA